MTKVFLDTNILLDYGQERDDFIYAKAILELGEQKKIELHASYLSYANMGYILRHYPTNEMWTLISEMREGINVLSTDSVQLDSTLNHVPVRDYEDLLQYRCALEGGCKVIVTNKSENQAHHWHQAF